MKRRYLIIWAAVMLMSWPLVLSAEVTTASLLEEMTDLQRLTRWPEPAYSNAQFSSYDRASKSFSDKKGWFANWDRGQFLREEEINGRKEKVMVDVDGPGALVRFWSANPKGTLRVYLDGGDQPVIEEDMEKLMVGEVEAFPMPLSGRRGKGCNLYFPIPYAKHCKVTLDDPEGDVYYHVNYRTYAEGTAVKSFSPADLKELKEKIRITAGKLANPRAGGSPNGAGEKQSFDVKVIPERYATLAELKGSKAIRVFELQLEGKNLGKAARGIVLYMEFDGQQTVATPLGDFFGTAPGLTPYEALPVGITDEKSQTLWSHWVMPFSESAKISVHNMSAQEVRIHGRLAAQDCEWNEQSLLFHAKWRIEREIATRPLSDWTHLACAGKGRFVGGHLHLQNPVVHWWGEGDEKIYVDGETFPSTFGTGTEDYYGYAWGSDERFVHAYHNQVVDDSEGLFGNVSNNRFHVIDDIPFGKSFQFDIENWHWNKNCTTTRAAISYWYARPGGWDFFGPIMMEDVQLQEVKPYGGRKVGGAIECEEMKVVGKQGEVKAVGWPFMSGGKQLRLKGDENDGQVTLGFDVAEGGEKEVLVRLIKHRHYAKVQLSVNGQKVGPVFDLYHQDREGTPEISLGAFELKKGQNTLTAEIVGKNDQASDAYMAGLDYIVVR
jgi:hypothetical protein